MSEDAEDKVLARREGGVAEIIFNNPAKRNAVSLDMWERVVELLTEFEADPDVRVLVVSGAGGKAFVSGADISKFESQRSSKEAVAYYGKISNSAYETLYNFPKPTIAKINGYCVGGGMALSVTCDIRYCEDGSRFAIPAARLGLGYGYPGIKRLADVVGISRAMEVFYTARMFSSQEAYEMGLVNAVVPVEELDDLVNRTTAMITENAPLTIATVKAAARQVTKPSGERDLAEIERMVETCFQSNDYTEGRTAFMEKRKPRFTGT